MLEESPFTATLLSFERHSPPDKVKEFNRIAEAQFNGMDILYRK